MSIDFGAVIKTIIPPGTIATAFGLLTKWIRKRRERVLLDMLEKADGPLSVSTIHTELLGKSLRGIPLRHVIPSLKPDGDVFNEADQIPPNVPLSIRLKYWFRITVKRELPSEETLTDNMRELKERGYVEHVVGDSWRIARKG